jgi:molecular chaperone HtpG
LFHFYRRPKEARYDLAMLSHRGFDRDQMEAFLERSNRILEMLGKD